MTSRSRLHVLLLDEGDPASLDALAASVAIFGGDGFELVPAPDRDSLWRTARNIAAAGVEAVVVVDVDCHPEPKSVLADVADTGFPVVVLTDGRNDAIHDHALSVGAAAYLPMTMPAREMVAWLTALASSADRPPGTPDSSEALPW